MGRSESAVDFLLAARAERRVFDSLPEYAMPFSLHEAYRAQQMLVRELLIRSGGRVIGYKIAATNAAAQRLLSVEAPFFGQLLSDSSYPSPATLQSGEFTVRCIEAEFGVEINADVPPTHSPYTRESIADFVSAVIPSLEIVDHRFVDWAAVGAPSLVADNAIHGAWIWGQPVSDWQGTDLAKQPVSLYANGRLVSTGSGASVLGHPLNVVAWLANELPRQGLHLRRGDRITTGTAAPVYFANKGDHVIANFGSLGQVELEWSA
jgi:2-keto-4-pentenoate hydratase